MALTIPNEIFPKLNSSTFQKSFHHQVNETSLPMVNFKVLISRPLDGGDKWNVKRPAMMANASLETCNSMAQQRLCVCVWTQPSAISDCLQGSRQNTPASQLIGKRKNAASCVIFCARLFVCDIRKRKRKVDGRPEFNQTIHLLPLAYRYHQLFCWLIDVHLYLTRVIESSCSRAQSRTPRPRR